MRLKARTLAKELGIMTLSRQKERLFCCNL
jgi:hypothetical protein